tara:strand:+ start:347 stop:532 length:186 start_codon:yes stop_codon:yes gene_type:complete
MENINALRLIKELVKASPLSEIMDEKSKKQVIEFIDVKIDIEMDTLNNINPWQLEKNHQKS